MKHKILESFKWLPPGDMRIKKGVGKKVNIRGRALFAGTVSRNMRKYVKEELVRAARTLVGKPVTINHDPHRIIGHVIDAEEEENAIEYVAEINKGNYPQKLLDRKSMSADSYYKKWMVNPISGVSVEADYRHNRCIECGESFYDQPSFEEHMWSAHKIKNFKFEPRGILMKALSLVEPPEKPGVPGTTIELMETKQGMSRLMETLTTDLKNEMEYKQKMKKAATVVTPIKTIALGRAKIKEQDEPCPEGQVRNEEGECVKDVAEQEGHGCAEDEEWNADQEKCVKKTVAEQDQTQQELPKPHVEPAAPCADGFEPDGEGGCKPIEWQAEPTADTPAPLMVPEPTIELPKVEVPTPAPAPVTGPVLEQDEGTDTPPMEPFPVAPPAVPAIEQPCPEGSHRDPESNNCVPDPIPTEVSDLVKEFKLPSLLKLGEPFADYTDFDDCVAKNKGKVDDPEAYCADIKRKVEGETVKEIYDPGRAYIRAIKTLERISKVGKTANTLNIASAKLLKEAANVPHLINRQVTTESRLRSAYDKAIVEYIHKLVPHLNKQVAKAIMEYQYNTTQHLARYFAGLIRNLTECSRKSDASLATYEKQTREVQKKQTDVSKNLATAIESLDKRVGQRKNDIEALNELDKRFKDMQKKMKEQEEEQKEKCPEGQHRNEEGQCVADEPSEEVKELKETVGKLTTKVENLEAKQKGEFKGQNKPLKTTKPDYSDPEKELRETAKKGK